MAYTPPKFESVIPQAVASGNIEETSILIIGAGPIGLALALDLGLRGHKVIVLNQQTQLTDGSRAICYAKRPLEIMDRLGFGDQMVAKGVSWNIGKVFFKDKEEPVYRFDLLPLKDQKMPAMVNVQQYYNEEYNIAALEKLDNVELRWGNELVELTDEQDHVLAKVKTEQGDYEIRADWLVACDGSRSATRKMLAMDFEGETFQDNFLIADVKFKKDYPTERHFWFDPPFNPKQSVLLHKQPDNVWRIDFQVGWDIDRDEIVKPENVTPRIQAMFGADVEFEYEWISVYTFNCRQITEMVRNRVIFAGDSAHLVSPFGARGANTGFQDGDNLAWKLDMVLQGSADEKLIKSYDEERSLAARINILNSTRSTDFITPKSKTSQQFRDSVLELSSHHDFARGFVNSGRLSTPVPYPDSSLNTPDEDQWHGGVAPGNNCIDAPVTIDGQQKWLLEFLGWKFKLLIFMDDLYIPQADIEAIKTLAQEEMPIEPLFVSNKSLKDIQCLKDVKSIAANRYDAMSGCVYLVRPDQYVAARWKNFDVNKIRTALQRATAMK